MRMRKKPWARPELEACEFFIQKPSEYKGRWKEFFKNDNPIYMELGCGKGTFMAVHGSQNPDINYITVDIKDEVLVLAKSFHKNIPYEDYDLIEFKDRISKGESLDSLLPEAFAVCREASSRVLGKKHFRVQLLGGMVLHQGRIAEMKTGEGKTLVATLP